MFHFSFFPKKKFLLFLFSCISFKYVLLLALVSEFNCFLRSRCSMEMWCPDDIGRDSWDWVGPPAWGRACFNSPEWGGGSSPVKTEPPQILLLLLLSSLLLFGTHLDDGCMSTRVGDALHTEYKFKRPGLCKDPSPTKKTSQRKPRCAPSGTATNKTRAVSQKPAEFDEFSMRPALQLFHLRPLILNFRSSSSPNSSSSSSMSKPSKIIR